MPRERIPANWELVMGRTPPGGGLWQVVLVGRLQLPASARMMRLFRIGRKRAAAPHAFDRRIQKPFQIAGSLRGEVQKPGAILCLDLEFQHHVSLCANAPRDVPYTINEQQLLGHHIPPICGHGADTD